MVKPIARRGAVRKTLDLDTAMLVGPHGRTAITLNDLSRIGVQFVSSEPLEVQDRLSVRLARGHAAPAMVVSIEGGMITCEFDAPISISAVRETLDAAARNAWRRERNDMGRHAELADDRWSWAARMRFILAASIILWALILVSAARLL